MTQFDEHVKTMQVSGVAIGTRGIRTFLIAKLPVLAFGPMPALINAVAGFLLNILFTQTEFKAFFEYTDFRVDRQGADFYKAAKEFAAASPEERKKLEPKFLAKFYEVGSLRS